MISSEPLSLEESARVAGHARWLETRLFEVLGSWVAFEPDPAAKVLWATHSRRHATVAQVWRDRQPRVAHLDREALTVAAGPDVTALVAALADLVDPAATLPRLVAVTRVVAPRRLAAYRTRRERAHPLADGPTLRWMRFLVSDVETGRAESGALLADRLDVPGVEEVARGVEETLAALVPDGDLIGLTNHSQL